jgi:DNA-binding MarR family transcriptional regulator
MDDLKDRQARSLGHILFQCARLFDERAQMRVNRTAGPKVMRPALSRLLPFLDDPEGVRVGVLAERADVSKQAVSQTLASLEADGLVVLRDDPDDARARRVLLTAAGRAGFGHGLQILATVEDELAASVGVQTMNQLFEALSAVLPALTALHDESAPVERPVSKTRVKRPATNTNQKTTKKTTKTTKKTTKTTKKALKKRAGSASRR